MASASAGTSFRARAWSVPSAPVDRARRRPNALNLPLEARSLSVHCLTGSVSPCRPDRRPLHPLEGEARHSSAAVRARHLQAAMPFRPQPILVCFYISPWIGDVARLSDYHRLTTNTHSIQPGRCSRSALDLPILSLSKPSAASLQGHHGQRHPARAASVQHHNRVPPVPPGPESAHLSLRGRYLPGG